MHGGSFVSPLRQYECDIINSRSSVLNHFEIMCTPLYPRCWTPVRDIVEGLHEPLEHLAPPLNVFRLVPGLKQ